MDELRKAAGTAVDVWDDTGTRHEDVVNAMNDLRKVLANNSNAAPVPAPQREWVSLSNETNAAPHARDAVAWTPETGYVFADAKNANAAPQREWVSLTDEEIDRTFESKVWDARRSYARAIEAALKEKNHG